MKQYIFAIDFNKRYYYPYFFKPKSLIRYLEDENNKIDCIDKNPTINSNIIKVKNPSSIYSNFGFDWILTPNYFDCLNEKNEFLLDSYLDTPDNHQKALIEYQKFLSLEINEATNKLTLPLYRQNWGRRPFCQKDLEVLEEDEQDFCKNSYLIEEYSNKIKNNYLPKLPSFNTLGIFLTKKPNFEELSLIKNTVIKWITYWCKMENHGFRLLSFSDFNIEEEKI